MSATRVAALAIATVLLRPAGAVEVTRCGQVLQPGEAGELRGDLNCVPPFSAEGVRLVGGSVLYLNGFAIRGIGTGVGVACASSGQDRPTCTVHGPGTISDFWSGMNGAGCRFVIRDVAFERNANGIFGPLACDLDATQVRVVESFEVAIWVSRMRARDLTVSDNARGLVARRLSAHRLIATGNALEGVHVGPGSGRSRLAHSTVIDNGSEGDGYDVTAGGRMRLIDVHCGRSARLEYPTEEGSDEEPRVVGSFGCADD